MDKELMQAVIETERVLLAKVNELVRLQKDLMDSLERIMTKDDIVERYQDIKKAG